MTDDQGDQPHDPLAELGIPEGYVLGDDGAYRDAANIATQLEAHGPYVIPLSLDGHEVLSFEPRRFSGWAAYISDEVIRGKAFLFLRIGPCDDTPDPPFAIREVHLAATLPADFPGSSLLRALPWERIEAAVNQPSRRAPLNELVMPVYGKAATGLPDLSGAWIHRPEPEPRPAPDLRLEIPAGYRKPDAFYAEVAERFLQIAAFSSRPAQELAEANGVKPTNVHRWIREAKARRLIALPWDRKARDAQDTQPDEESPRRSP